MSHAENKQNLRDLSGFIMTDLLYFRKLTRASGAGTEWGRTAAKGHSLVARGAGGLRAWPGLAPLGPLDKGALGRPCSQHAPMAHSCPRALPCSFLAEGDGQPHSLSSARRWRREKTARLFSPICAPLGRRTVLGSFAIEPTVPIMNQELREIFKIKSETTGYVQEGDDYAWEFLSVAAVPLCLFTFG